MRKILIAAAVATLGTVVLPMAPASAQGWYGGRGDVRQEMRECRRELRRADSRREYRRELRECRREIARAQRGNRYGYYNQRGNRYGYYRGRGHNNRWWDGRRWRYRRY